MRTRGRFLAHGLTLAPCLALALHGSGAIDARQRREMPRSAASKTSR